MHAKKIDKLATGILYTIAGIIVAILASLLLYILLKGLPHVNWSLKSYHLSHQLLLDCLVILFLLFNFNMVSQLSLVPLP